MHDYAQIHVYKTRDVTTAATHLQTEQDDSAHPEPAVQRVHVGDLLGFGEVVRVEDGDETEGCAAERQDVQQSVQDLHALLPVVHEDPVHQNRCEINESYITSHTLYTAHELLSMATHNRFSPFP